MAYDFFQFKVENPYRNKLLSPVVFQLVPIAGAFVLFPLFIIPASLIGKTVAPIVAFVLFGVCFFALAHFPIRYFRKRFGLKYLANTLVQISDSELTVRMTDEEHQLLASYVFPLDGIVNIGTSKSMLQKGQTNRKGNSLVFHKLSIRQDDTTEVRLQLADPIYSQMLKGKDIEQFESLCRRLIEYRENARKAEPARILHKQVPFLWHFPVQIVMFLGTPLLIFVFAVLGIMGILYVLTTLGLFHL